MKKTIPLEMSEFLPRIHSDIAQRFPITIFFLLVMLVSKFLLRIELPGILFLLVTVLLVLSVPLDFFIRYSREKNPQAVINAYFWYLVFELTAIALVVNLAGGITWIIPSVYLLYLTTFFWLFPKDKAILLTLFVNLLFFALVAGNFSGILSPKEIFSPGEKHPQNISFITLSVLVALATIVFVGHSSDAFYKLISAKIEELKRKRQELLQVKKNLEAEIEMRTQELAEGRKQMEKTIKEKTKELYEKRKIIEARVKELENYHKMAIARELEMIEVKEKIEKLKERYV